MAFLEHLDTPYPRHNHNRRQRVGLGGRQPTQFNDYYVMFGLFSFIVKFNGNLGSSSNI
jgi:hypothetical protein